jgi:TetR/AcrR family transcriptional regulator, transcriptional repressor for nem operon
MDIRKPAIHYHFPSKTDLGICVINKELETMAREQGEWKQLPGDQQLKKIVERFFSSSRSGRICLTGSLTPDYVILPPPMQEKVQEMCRAILEWMTTCLEKGRTEGSLHFQGEGKDRALLVMSGLLSSLLLSRVLGNAVFDSMIGQLLEDMGATFQGNDKDRSEQPEDDELAKLWGI